MHNRPVLNLLKPVNPRYALFLIWLLGVCFALEGSGVRAESVAVPVTTGRRGTIVSMADYPGHLQPQTEVQVFANVSGKLVTLNADIGQRVKKGAVLAETHSDSTRLAVIRAAAALSRAESQLTLTEANAQARVESQLAVAQEAVRTAESQLEETRSLAETRTRNQLRQAEVAYEAATSELDRSKTNAEQALERAKANLDKTQLDFDRNRVLHEKQHISDSDFESAEQRLRVVKTQYEEAVVRAGQFRTDGTHPSIEKAKAELAVAQKVVENRGWEREIAAAESKVVQTQASLTTAEKLVAAKAWEREIAIAKAAVDQAAEEHRLATAQAAAATVNAPIDGVIAARGLNVGDYVQSAAVPAAKPIVTLIATDLLKASWYMPAQAARRIRIGDLALISTDSGIRNIPSTIRFISPTIRTEDNTVLVQATLPNPDPENMLKPGATLKVAMKTAERKEVRLLPLHAVLNIQNGRGTIFVVEEGVARAKQVDVGAVYAREIEVTSQLPARTRVIVGEQHRLQDGIAVSIIED